MAPRCKDCKFPLPIGMGKNGKGEEVPVNLCRRFPPQLAVNGSSTYPVVSDDEWCGEFQSLVKVMPKTAKPKPKAKRTR